MRERRLFSEEFKREAYQAGRPAWCSKAGIARDLVVSTNLLMRSCRKANVDARLAAERSFPARSMSACGVNWQRLKRNATY